MLELAIVVCHRCELRQRPCAGRCVCLIDDVDIVEHARSGICLHPSGSRFDGAELLPPTPPPINPDIAHQLWHEIHANPAPDMAFVESVRARLPCGDCKRHFNEFVAANPPTPGYRWGFDLHNAVNATLGKPALDWPEAVKIYGW